MNLVSPLLMSLAVFISHERISAKYLLVELESEPGNTGGKIVPAPNIQGIIYKHTGTLIAAISINIMYLEPILLN